MACQKHVNSVLHKCAIVHLVPNNCVILPTNQTQPQLAKRLPKHYQITKNPYKRYQEILQLPNHYQVATIFGVICDQQITTRQLPMVVKIKQNNNRRSTQNQTWNLDKRSQCEFSTAPVGLRRILLLRTKHFKNILARGFISQFKTPK